MTASKIGQLQLAEKTVSDHTVVESASGIIILSSSRPLQLASPNTTQQEENIVINSQQSCSNHLDSLGDDLSQYACYAKDCQQVDGTVLCRWKKFC